ncbi:hypothetical protein GCM10008090_12890 [Arenicella chitinivorans]|uniref:Restriction system protein n=1 Tax=Arenicella chitinivorans TaxID=1329800 RepID=A0A918RME4_9GAMM|nr:restriction endonuclease [Arenicella chitinivorans]GHA04833.1 hypothetical protein GCM10008090_12890 [Arenicella chitinivorans]
MARRKRRDQSGAEVLFGIIVIIPILLYLNGVSVGTALTWGAIIIVSFLLMALSIWFIHGLTKPSPPLDLTGAGKTHSKAHRAKSRAKNQRATKLPIISPEPTQPPQHWSTELIGQLEWRVFEKLCTRLWELKGFNAKETQTGADGGVDFYLYANTTQQKIGAVQCKSWGKKQIGVSVIRELQGVVAAEQLKLGLLMYTGQLSKDAQNFLQQPSVSIKAQNQHDILSEIQKLPTETQASLLRETTQGDYTTPSCPNCDQKLVQRTAKKTGKVFMGCVNFPRCRYTI